MRIDHIFGRKSRFICGVILDLLLFLVVAKLLLDHPPSLAHPYSLPWPFGIIATVDARPLPRICFDGASWLTFSIPGSIDLMESNDYLLNEFETPKAISVCMELMYL